MAALINGVQSEQPSSVHSAEDCRSYITLKWFDVYILTKKHGLHEREIEISPIPVFLFPTRKLRIRLRVQSSFLGASET